MLTPWEQRQDVFAFGLWEERRSGIGRCYHEGHGRSLTVAVRGFLLAE